MYPQQFAVNPPPPGANYHIDIASGNSDLREGILSADEMIRKWNAEAETFRSVHEKYIIYR